MNQEIRVSTPSRICLFGEHQDYLGLEVIACAIDLRFSARIRKTEGSVIRIRIRDSKIDTLGTENTQNLYEEYQIDLAKPIVYENKRDYLKSSVNVLLKNGYPLQGFDIVMDSEIPIGKGMCSSSTMIVVLIGAMLCALDHPDATDMEKLAYLGFCAEVLEFNEPGGMMDHYTSALGSLVNLDFAGGKTSVHPLQNKIDGCFILFDSLAQKNTTKVLADAKTPTLSALAKLGTDIKALAAEGAQLPDLSALDEKEKTALLANISNYKILQEAKKYFAEEENDPPKLGALLSAHHDNLRKLGVSTGKIDQIIQTACQAGAYGGKVNGSGGGGCCYVYAAAKDADRIIEAVGKLDYPAKILKQDTGFRRDV